MSLVMGMDQHRAQISAEWIDTVTGEIVRERIAPADRAGVRAFLANFGREPLEVALEATTGWRFVVEELDRIGAEVHLAEPAETSALKGKKKRAKTDWADARHLRELLLIGRLPESWIPPAHLLDLRARVRSRHTLSHERCEWQQRMQAVLYHHGFPQQRNLLTLERREWIAGLTLAAGVTINGNVLMNRHGLIWEPINRLGFWSGAIQGLTFPHLTPFTTIVAQNAYSPGDPMALDSSRIYLATTNGTLLSAPF